MFLGGAAAAASASGGGEPGGPIRAAIVIQTNQPAPGVVCYSDGTYLFNAAGETIPPNATFRDTGIVVGSLAQFTSGSGNNLQFNLNQVSVPNTDATFQNIRISGVFSTGQQELIYQRSAAAYLASNGGVQSQWAWPETTHLLVGGNTYDIDFDVSSGPQFHTLVAADVQNTAIGFVDVQGFGPFGSFDPRNSSGWPVGRLTYGGNANSVSFSFRGDRPNTDASWRLIQVTGQFQNGSATKTISRANADFNGYQAGTDETIWGLPEFTDSFVVGQSYQVTILDRTPG